MSHRFMNDGREPIQIGLDFVCVCGLRGTHPDVARHIAEASPVAMPAEQIRLRMKVWTDPKTARGYLIPTAFMRDVVNGRPISDVMCAYAMSDDDTRIVTLTADEWNTL